MTVKDIDSDLKLIRSLIKKGYQPLVAWIRENSDQWQQANETAHLHITSRRPKEGIAGEDRKQALALAISIAPRTPNEPVPTDVEQTLTAVVDAQFKCTPKRQTRTSRQHSPHQRDSTYPPTADRSLPNLTAVFRRPWQDDA